VLYNSTMKPSAPLLVLGLLHQALCGQIPPAVIPAAVSVNIHFVTGHTRDLDLITNAGFRFVRMDFSWEATERKVGVYDLRMNSIMSCACEKWETKSGPAD